MIGRFRPLPLAVAYCGLALKDQAHEPILP